jgi:hypothetical protein
MHMSVLAPADYGRDQEQYHVEDEHECMHVGMSTAWQQGSAGAWL